MFLFLKGKGGYMVIGLVEVLWKVFSVVVNCFLKRSVVLYDVLHVFREGWGGVTANLEANMNHHLDGIAHKPLFQVFLDVRKAYESLDRGR